MARAIDGSVDPVANPLSNPVGYDSATRTHTVYSEDFSLLGLREYTVKASLEDYPTTTSAQPDASAMIEFIDPCPDPESVQAIV